MTTSDAGRVLSPAAEVLPLTGERTVPGIPEENYWFQDPQPLC